MDIKSYITQFNGSVRDAISTMALLERAQPGDRLAGEWDEQGFHPTGLLRDGPPLVTGPSKWVTEAAAEIHERMKERMGPEEFARMISKPLPPHLIDTMMKAAKADVEAVESVHPAERRETLNELARSANQQGGNDY